MSEWTYVRGGLELDSSPFELDKNFNLKHPEKEDYETEEAYDEAVEEYRTAYHKAVYLPYPEEQFKLGAPIAGTTPDYTKKKVKNEFGFEVYPQKRCIKFDGTAIYSLPRAKPIIERAFDLFPQGELGFRYSLDQIRTDASCFSGGFIHPCLYEYYHNAIDKLYGSLPAKWGDSWSYKELNEHIGVEEDSSYAVVSEIVCGINTSLRDATADEVYHSLLEFLKYLAENDIDVRHGYIEWHDSYSYFSGYRYAFRPGECFGEWCIMKLDYNTNEILWKHTRKLKRPRGEKREFEEKIEQIKEPKKGD